MIACSSVALPAWRRWLQAGPLQSCVRTGVRVGGHTHSESAPGRRTCPAAALVAVRCWLRVPVWMGDTCAQLSAAYMRTLTYAQALLLLPNAIYMLSTVAQQGRCAATDALGFQAKPLRC
jgi:hypothetical protein